MSARRGERRRALRLANASVALCTGWLACGVFASLVPGGIAREDRDAPRSADAALSLPPPGERSGHAGRTRDAGASARGLAMRLAEQRIAHQRRQRLLARRPPALRRLASGAALDPAMRRAFAADAERLAARVGRDVREAPWHR